MKKILLSFVIAVVALSTSMAQTCTPAENLPDTVIVSPTAFVPTTNPMGGINDTACVNEPFEFVFTVKVPAIFESPFGPVPINSVQMATQGAVSNLPVGMGYVCNPPNCVFPKDSTGCILLFGTPTDTAGVYDLSISFLIKTPLIDLPLNFPNPSLAPGNYFLHVKPQGQCATSNVRDLSELGVSARVRPNPFSGFAQVVINTPITGSFDFTVSDLLGRKIHRERVQLIEGENTIDFDGSRLAAGIYIFNLSDGERQLSDKMVINRN